MIIDRHRVLSPTRICISGEDLDWLGGQSVCAGIDLYTAVQLDPPPEEAKPQGGMTVQDMYGFLRRRHDGLAAEPPPARIECSAPSPGGLGTSSSICLGYYAALKLAGHVPPELSIVEAAYAYEFDFTHGGGMDHLAIVLGGWVLTDGIDLRLPRVIDRRSEPREWIVTLVYSGIDKNCPDHMRTMREAIERDSHNYDAYKRDCSRVSMRAWRALTAGDLSSLHLCIAEAHRMMRDLQKMSTPAIEVLRTRLESATGLPFKLTGSGSGGCLFTIHTSSHGKEVEVMHALIAGGVNRADIYQARVTGEGML